MVAQSSKSERIMKNYVSSYRKLKHHLHAEG
jgi:hypothetical protein